MKLSKLITEPNGLIPYLEANLGGTWKNFNIRRATGVLQGLRVTSDRLETFGMMPSEGNREQSLVIGFIITVTGDPIDTQMIAADFRDDIDRTILKWAKTKAVVGLSSNIESISGVMDFKQISGKSSGEPNAWTVTVVRELALSYVV